MTDEDVIVIGVNQDVFLIDEPDPPESPPPENEAARRVEPAGRMTTSVETPQLPQTAPTVNAGIPGRTVKPPSGSESGYIKFHRSSDAVHLLTHPKAFALLAQIVVRANWRTGMNDSGLHPGQAFIGDHRSIGLTQKQYRIAKEVLAKLGHATFAGRNRGTIATLSKQTIFDLNIGWEPEMGRNKGEQKASKGADRKEAVTGTESIDSGNLSETMGDQKGEQNARKGRLTKNVSERSKPAIASPNFAPGVPPSQSGSESRTGNEATELGPETDLPDFAAT